MQCHDIDEFFSWEISEHLKKNLRPHGLFPIKVNALSAKACFLKLKIDTPLSSSFSKTATSFLHLEAKLRIYQN